MKKILEGSAIWRALTAAARWIDGQWSKSLLSKPFTPPERRGSSGALSSMAHKVHLAMCRVFDLTRLTTALEGSVTLRSFFWMALAVTLAPILPTMAVLALTALGFGSLILTYGHDRDRRFSGSPLVKWILLFAGVELASTALSVTLTGSLRNGLLTAAFTLFALVVTDTCRKERDLDRLIALIVAAGALVALIGISQAALGVASESDWIDEDDFSNITIRVWSTLENPNVLAEYLLLVIPLAVAGIFTSVSASGKIYSAVAAGTMVLCMLLTWSRGGWLGLAIAAAVFLVLLDRRFIPVGIVGLVVLLLILPESIMARLASVGDLSDSSTSYRVYIWMAAVNMLKDFWLCGFGTGTAAFRSVYPAYSFNAVSAPHSHNLYLQVFCENGLLGIVALLGAMCSGVLALGRTLTVTGSKKTRVRACALMASLAGFAAQSLTDYSFYNYRVTLMFWVTVGLIAALYNAALREGRE